MEHWSVVVEGTPGGLQCDLYDSREQAVAAWHAALESLDVLVFGPHVTCSCDGETMCAPCKLQAYANAVAADARMSPSEGELSFVDRDTAGHDVRVYTEQAPY